MAKQIEACQLWQFLPVELLRLRVDPYVHVVLVVWVGLHDALRPSDVCLIADENELGSCLDEPVDDVLRQGEVDLAGMSGLGWFPVFSRVVDIDVEPVLVRDVVIQWPAFGCRDIAYQERGSLWVR